MQRQQNETVKDFNECVNRSRAVMQYHFARLWPQRAKAHVRASIRANICGQRSCKVVRT